MEQCKIKNAIVGKYLRMMSAASMLEEQQNLSKHIATCQEESCKLSLVARVAIKLQTEQGVYLKDEEYEQETFNECNKDDDEGDEE